MPLGRNLVETIVARNELFFGVLVVRACVLGATILYLVGKSDTKR